MRCVPSPVSRFWIIIRPLADSLAHGPACCALLLTAALIAHAQLAWICVGASSTSQRMPCCPYPTPDQSVADASAGLAGLGLIVYPSGCASLNHCTCAQPLSAARVLSAPLRSAHSVRIPALIWGKMARAALEKPQSQGPLLARYAALIGRQTYLGTLRLRI